jgi:hypothetical protein
MLVINHEEISEEVFKRLIEETVIEVTERNLKNILLPVAGRI